MSGTYPLVALNGTIKSVTTGKMLAVEPSVILLGAVPFRMEGVPTFSITTGRSVLVNTIDWTGFIRDAVWWS